MTCNMKPKLCKRHLTDRTTGRALPRPCIRARPAETEPAFVGRPSGVVIHFQLYLFHSDA